MPKIIQNLPEKLIEETRRQVMEVGYTALNMREIARNCGVGIGTVYNYFPSKDALIAQFLLQDWKVSLERIHLSVRESSDAEAVCAAATIDLKKDEKGLLDFCPAHGWSLATYSAGELRQAEGTFTASAFVEQTTGVDNVCERSAVLAAEGPLYEQKHAGGGVTMALAWKPVRLDWRWQDG